MTNEANKLETRKHNECQKQSTLSHSHSQSLCAPQHKAHQSSSHTRNKRRAHATTTNKRTHAKCNYCKQSDSSAVHLKSICSLHGAHARTKSAQKLPRSLALLVLQPLGFQGDESTPAYLRLPFQTTSMQMSTPMKRATINLDISLQHQINRTNTPAQAKLAIR